MRFSMRNYILVGVFVLSQLSFGAQKLKEGNHGEIGKASELNKQTEQLIEKILYLVKDYHAKVRNIYKCVPDKVVEITKEIIQNSTDCLDEIEKKLDRRQTTKNNFEKLFLRCLEEEKKKAVNLTSIIDTTVDLCQYNITEKTYQINVNTTSKKAFHMSLKRGSNILQRTIVLESKESNLTNENWVSLKREDECDTEEPEVTTREDAYEMDNSGVHTVDYIEEDPYNLEHKEAFVKTEKSQTEAETQSIIQRSNSEEDDELEKSVGLKVDI